MKDTFASSPATAVRPRGDLMVPAKGSFTRPRRFDDAAQDLVDEAEIVMEEKAPKLPSSYPEETNLAAAPRDLWALLHTQEPGKDQHILEGSQAAEDFRATDVSRAFDLLRTRLRQTVKQHGWVNIAVASPTTGCGNTFTAANLAASLARVPSSRTVLMDFNMRSPGLAKTLDMDASQTGDLRDFLAGDVAISDYILRASDTLAVGLGSSAQADAAEIMQDPATAASLAEMRAALRPDIVLYDMPPLLSHDDTSAFLPQLDGVLLVSDGTQTMAKHIAECERILDGQVPLLGVILNRARASSIERF
ncbi:CpsD/CapB family tyrosine-protein kinase [Sulfitobacter donghicola]|uniref:Exopolysaccharide biosynthesis protein n=1 Tax=Sulfitobacter donghicola DSW-25 = KCTC 12864 = JCM 14565 TaxID=1300350 RepID=A0A073II69_9RHOB|nr:CpsD/CapB family tyrosine-protein kinase [Sulfitobacter donghicola]KEJ89265.1 exopolysaccharide biosynthesis protein [Sulfitobacter donghicola DSW-25 = KCTC 12864 = JCM 14565]